MVKDFLKRSKEKEFTEEEEDILISILPDYIDIIESKQSDASTKKAKDDAWYKITALFRKKSGKFRSRKCLRSKYGTVKRKMNKVAVGYKNGEKSQSNKIFRNGLDSDHSAILETYDPEMVTIEGESPLLIPMETRKVMIEEKDPLQLPMEEAQVVVEIDPLQLPMDTAQVAFVENDPLQLPTETAQIQPLGISHLQPGDWLKINSLFGKKQKNQSSLKTKIKDDFNRAKDTFCQPKTNYADDKMYVVQKRILEIEEARNEREKIMLQIEVERNEREKSMLHIEEERNEREKKNLQFKAKRIEQIEKIIHFKEKKRNEQNVRIRQLEAKRIEQSERIERLEAEKKNEEKLILQLKSKINNSSI